MDLGSLKSDLLKSLKPKENIKILGKAIIKPKKPTQALLNICIINEAL